MAAPGDHWRFCREKPRGGMSTKVTTYFKVQGWHEEVRGLVEPGLIEYFVGSQDSRDTPQASPSMSLAHLQ